jgi:hypothetical protein
MFLHKSTNAAREIREIIQGLTIFGMSIYRWLPCLWIY